MKITRATWDHYKRDLPDGNPAMYVDAEHYELTLVPELHSIEAVHRATGDVFLLDQTGAVMRPEKAPVVPVAPEASGSARTVKSSRR